MECCKASQFPNVAGASVIPSCFFTFARVIPTLFKFFVKTFFGLLSLIVLVICIHAGKL